MQHRFTWQTFVHTLYLHNYNIIIIIIMKMNIVQKYTKKNEKCSLRELKVWTYDHTAFKHSIHKVDFTNFLKR